MRHLKQIIRSTHERRTQMQRPSKHGVLEAYEKDIFDAIEAGYPLSAIHEALKVYMGDEGKECCSLSTLSRFVKKRRPDLSAKFLAPNKVGSGTRKKKAMPNNPPKPEPDEQSGIEQGKQDLPESEDTQAANSKPEPDEGVEVRAVPSKRKKRRRKRWADMTDEERKAEIEEDAKRLDNPTKYMNGDPEK